MTEPLQVTLATRNSGKVQEFNRLLGGVFTLVPLPATVDLPPESGTTFQENARLKALAAFTALGGKQGVLADDSGLEVEALGGKPGVLSARYAGERATDADNVRKLLDELAGISQRTARFVCVLCLALPQDDGDAGSLVREGTSSKPLLVEV
ncbi:MAG: xanthosine triphosphate pyrophosphatase, partial [Thermoleophilia bacterium]|nr:xanthosine triphosphate pyrophosphatase [Thermoleophilia bacterium]